jgi:hypothetical protein
MKYNKNILLLIPVFFALGSTILLIPGLRYSIIFLAEAVLKKTLFREFWFLFLRSAAITGFFIAALSGFAIATKTGRTLCAECHGIWKQSILSLRQKTYMIWFLILAAIYIAGIINLIRANFYYNDDLDRALKGYRGWSVWGRYIADFFSVIMHMNLRLTDISPLPQILAALILAASTLAFLKIFSPEKITVAALLSAIPIGLSPYFMENYSYKFDAPYMAMAVFFSIIPFLFYRKTAVFCVTSFFSLIAMCMSYQAASGIYVFMVLIIACRLWVSGETPLKSIFVFLAASVSSYLIALLFFKTALFVTMPEDGSGYVSTSLLALNRIFPGILLNSIVYLRTIAGDFKNNLFVVVLAFVLFIIINVVISKRNRLLTLAVMLIIVPVMFVLSYGAYLALQKPLWLPRAFVGFGVFIAAILTYSATIPVSNKVLNICSVLAALLVSYNFLVFDLSYGNALAEQKQYQNFRTTLLIADINRCLDNTIGEPIVHIENSIGFSPIIDNISKTWPLIERIVYVSLSGGSDWGHLPLHHYRFRHLNDYEQNNDYADGMDAKSLPVLIDNGYHTIRGGSNYFFVILK